MNTPSMIQVPMTPSELWTVIHTLSEANRVTDPKTSERTWIAHRMMQLVPNDPLQSNTQVYPSPEVNSVVKMLMEMSQIQRREVFELIRSNFCIVCGRDTRRPPMGQGQCRCARNPSAWQKGGPV
jgi:hypothetical protein